MIERYSLSPLREIWEDRHKFSTWLRIEILVCEALTARGKIPTADMERIRERAAFDAARIAEIEEETNHDVIAFLTNVAENVGESSRYIHLGLTSSDLLDTTLACQMKEAGTAILSEVDRLLEVVARRALAEKDTPMIGRTHGMQAEPITLGLKLATWHDELSRGRERFARSIDEVSHGKISGAVGTYAHLDAGIEEEVMRKLGLRPAPVSTQIVPRDRHAAYLSAIALLGCSLDRFATEIRNLQRTEIGELGEPFRRGQKGSSAMPHKMNPILSERVAGLARILRGNSLAAMENVTLWHERDITHSSVERVIIPDSTILIHYMLAKFRQVVEGLRVDRERMAANLRQTEGMIFSQGLLLALVQKGITREDAYRIVQSVALEADRGVSFRERAVGNGEIAKHLSPEEIMGCFDLKRHLRNVDMIFERLGLTERGKRAR